MDGLLAAVALPVAVFAGTNIDGFFFLAALFTAARATGRPPRRAIWIGQYAGTAVLVLASGLIAAGLAVFPGDRAGLLGLVPAAVGALGLARAIRTRHQVCAATLTPLGTTSVAAMTISSGGDNITMYAPLFRAVGVRSSLLAVAVFAVLVAAWCLAASRPSGHERTVAMARRGLRWVGPVTLIAIGAALVVRSGAIVPHA